MGKVGQVQIRAFYDKTTGTLTYLVYDEVSKDAIVIDPVLDYEPQSSSTATISVDKVLAFVKENQLNVKLIAETHAHADHLSGAQLIKKENPDAEVAIGEGVTQSQTKFKKIFNLPESFPTDGSQFDRLLKHGDTVRVGTLSFEVIATPGHTPGCSSYRFGNHVFTGDALFMPDYGTGRCDFPGGSAADQFDSVTQRLYTLPDETITYVGHDYMPGGRDLKYSATISQQKETNVHVAATTDKRDFVSNKEAADQKKGAPRLLFQSVQVNIDAGRLPDPKDNEIRYLRIPINIFPPKHLLSEADKKQISADEITGLKQPGTERRSGMNRFRATVPVLGVLALIVCLSCASSRQSAGPSGEPIATAAEEAAADSGDSGRPAESGAAFYETNGCSSCHGTTGGGAIQGPGIRGEKAADLLSFMDGSAMHSGGSVGGVTASDAENLEAFLSASP